VDQQLPSTLVTNCYHSKVAVTLPALGPSCQLLRMPSSAANNNFNTD